MTATERIFWRLAEQLCPPEIVASLRQTHAKDRWPIDEDRVVNLVRARMTELRYEKDGPRKEHLSSAIREALGMGLPIPALHEGSVWAAVLSICDAPGRPELRIDAIRAIVLAQTTETAPIPEKQTPTSEDKTK